MPATNTGTSSPKQHIVHRESTDLSEQHLLPLHAQGYPNQWASLREYIKEPAAEFFGTLLLVLIGTGANVQSAVSGGRTDYSFLGWGAAIALGAWVSAGISGGHINPAVTLAFAIFRRFPWKKVPIYFAAQLLGALCGAAITYANYHQAIQIFEGGAKTLKTAGLFGTFPAPHISSAGAFFEEFLGTAILLMVICAVTDKRNGPPPPGLVPLVLFFTLFGISVSLGFQTGFALNPARDFGPRALTAMVGYGKQVFTFRSNYWIWGGIMSPFLGAIAGVFTYDLLIFTGQESIVNSSGAHQNQHGATTTYVVDTV